MFHKSVVFGIDANHVRWQAYCSRCNAPWGTCAHQGVYPINQNDQRLHLESQLQHSSGGYYAGGQQMYCGSCRQPFGSCGCVGYGPIDPYGNALQFEGLMLEEIGIAEGDPGLAMEGALLSGQGFGGAMEALVEAEVVEEIGDAIFGGNDDGWL